MSTLHWLRATLSHFFARLLALAVPFGRSAPRPMLGSRYNDLFYGVVTSALAVGMLLPLQPGQVAGVAPEPPRPALHAVVEQFAPEVRLHPEERYFPSSVSWYLQRTSLRDAPAVGASFLHIPDDANRQHVRAGDLDNARTYVHARPRGEDGLDIQYWFFFPYNGPLIGGPAGGAHEGDWEHITVRLDASWRRIQKVFFAAHDAEGRWHEPKDLQFSHETHPVVYSARYGHASYPTAGLQSRGMLPADRTADGGAIWQTWLSFKIIAGPDGLRSDLAWLDFAGRWGRPGTFFSGPHGPSFQAYWMSES